MYILLKKILNGSKLIKKKKESITVISLILKREIMKSIRVQSEPKTSSFKFSNGPSLAGFICIRGAKTPSFLLSVYPKSISIQQAIYKDVFLKNIVLFI